MALTHVRYEAPGWGVGELWLRGDVVLESRLPRPGQRPAGEHPLVPRLQAFFGGERVSFADVELELDEGSEFQERLARVLQAVPWGEVVTYGELAALAGRPRAARAAGTFLAHCRHAPFLPAHRVVSVDGIGGWGTLGVEYKRRLLELEGVAL